MIDIKLRLKYYQTIMGLNNNKLAERSDLDPSVICSIYTRSYEPTITTLNSICKGLGITLSEFFAEDEKYTELTEVERAFLKILNRVPKRKHELLRQILLEMAEDIILPYGG